MQFTINDPEDMGIVSDLAGKRSATQELTDALMELVRLSRTFAESQTIRLSHVQFAMLSLLSRGTDLTITALADELGYDLSVLSRQAATLTDQGLVTRTRDPLDKRSWRLSLTEHGHERIMSARSTRMEMFHSALAAYSDQERKTAAAVVTSVNSILSETLKRKGVALG